MLWTEGVRSAVIQIINQNSPNMSFYYNDILSSNVETIPPTIHTVKVKWNNFYCNYSFDITVNSQIPLYKITLDDSNCTVIPDKNIVPYVSNIQTKSVDTALNTITLGWISVYTVLITLVFIFWSLIVYFVNDYAKKNRFLFFKNIRNDK